MTQDRLAIDGGTPIRTADFPAWPQYDDTERSALMRAVDQGQWWRVGGGEVTAFEREFASFVGAPAGLAVTNGTHALELALELEGVGPGDEVIIPAFTFISTSNAVQRLGAVPVPAEIDPETYCLDPAALDAAYSEHTKAVIPVHLAGQVADMNAISEWAQRRGVAVVQDAAHAHGATWQGKRLGELGTVACYSFQNGKLMTAGEGGAITLADAADYDDAFARHSCGRPLGDRDYRHRTPSSNFRMTEFSGAVLRAQLTRLADQNARRGAQWLVDSYAGPQHAHRKTMQAVRTYDGKEPAQHYVDSVILHGTPESLIDQVARLKEEIGLNYLMCAPLSRDTFRLLVDKVLPRL